MPMLLHSSYVQILAYLYTGVSLDPAYNVKPRKMQTLQWLLPFWIGFVCQPLDPLFHQSGKNRNCKNSGNLGEVKKIHDQFATFDWIWPCLRVGIESDTVLKAF